MITHAFHTVKDFIERYEQRLSLLAMATGFVFDSLTLKGAAILLDDFIFLGYILIVGASIAFMNAHQAGKLRGRFFDWLSPWPPFFMQFAFGGLFSGFLIFYFRSASLATSWPFLLFLGGMLVGNEFFRERYERLTFHTSVYFLVLFSFLIFFVPVLVHSVGVWVFLLSGVIALIAIGGFIYLLYRGAPWRVVSDRHALLWSVGGIFLVMNILYFTNIIPPIPLALKAGGIYHLVERRGGEYVARAEATPWYAFLRARDIIHIADSESFYAYSAVFAPTAFNTTIVHEWRYLNPATEKWEVRSRVRFPIIGGRDGGYRGYSIKDVVAPGKWRVDVKTGRGQVIGRISFTVEKAETQPPLEEKPLQ